MSFRCVCVEEAQNFSKFARDVIPADPMSGEPLLAGSLGLRLQNLVDEGERRFHHPAMTGLMAGIDEGCVRQDLLQRTHAEVVFVVGGPLAQLVRQHQTEDLRPEYRSVWTPVSS